MQDVAPHTETYSMPAPDSGATAPAREPVRLILIGPMPGINLIISVLHRLGFAEPGAWSTPQTDPASGRPMRILTKWVRH